MGSPSSSHQGWQNPRDGGGGGRGFVVLRAPWPHLTMDGTVSQLGTADVRVVMALAFSLYFPCISAFDDSWMGGAQLSTWSKTVGLGVGMDDLDSPPH